jgi:hypothetical protein
VTGLLYIDQHGYASIFSRITMHQFGAVLVTREMQ